MSLHEKLSDKSLFYKSKAKICLDHYDESKSIQFEPNWIHPAYEILQKFYQDELPAEKFPLVKEIIVSHECVDGLAVSAHS